MSDDSGDCSDFDPRPSGSKSRTRGGDQKRKRRIVMRIEFDDSDEDSSSTASERTSGDGDADDLDEHPSCSSAAVGKRRSSRRNGSAQFASREDADDSAEFQRNAARCLRNRKSNTINNFSDDSSSGSEITLRARKRAGNNRKSKKRLVVSEDEPENEVPSNQARERVNAEAGFASDSSSNELLEKCPICLLTFRQQEIGSPSACEHIFCANCIEAWSKNVQTCPIDRLEFDRIIVRETYENRRIVREIVVDPKKSNKELVFDEDEQGDEDVTYCEICDSHEREDVMLLCDSCNQGYHIDCLSPPLSEIPEGSWYCDNCFDSQDEAEDDGVEEDLNMLYEDIRDMGIPEASLRVTEVHQPRILRTRQNERIRAAVLRRTRGNISRTQTTTTTTTSSTSHRGRPRNSSTTTTTTTTTRTRRTKSAATSGRSNRHTRRRKRRSTRQRTYVVEYDLNNFDEKFAIKTTKKIIRRRRRKRRTGRRSAKSATGERLTASQRLAEQLGVKSDRTFGSQLSGAGVGLSLFGNANELEYFSDSDTGGGGVESDIQFDTGHGAAVQTSVRISTYGPQRTRSKGLLLGRLQGRSGSALPMPTPSNPDILSSIIDLQDRWHNATRNMESVRINPDGTLKFQESERRRDEPTVVPATDSRTSTNIAPTVEGNKERSETVNPNTAPNPSNVTQAPMYPRGGGGNPNFGSGGGGGGHYNNRFNNQGNYRGGGGGGNQYRHSTGGNSGMGGGGSGINFNSNMIGRGNFNFSGQNFNQDNQNTNFSPFSIRFNQRNQRNNNNNQRSSLPFINRNDNMPAAQEQNAPNFGNQQANQSSENNNNSLFSGLPLPIIGPMNRPDENSLFGGLPSPMIGPPPAIVSNQTATVAATGSNVIPPLMTIPPPPAPPPGVPMPWNTSLLQLNADYGNDDDDSNCPNFSVYSAESQEVAAKSSDSVTNIQNDGETTKEDDENEDLVQLDDDDDIPMPPEPKAIENSDLYEPENPTEENDDDNEEENAEEQAEEANKLTENNSVEADDDQYDPAKETPSQTISNEETSNLDTEKTDQELEDNKSINENDDEKNDKDETNRKDRHSPSPAPSEIKLRENETNAANRKGVLELYDDSDWEELEIDKPKSIEGNARAGKDVDKSQKSPPEEANIEETTEPDRSYTPCLDENNEPEEAEGGTPEIRSPMAQNRSVNDVDVEENKTTDGAEQPGIAGMETELISDEDDDNRGRSGGKRRKDDKREKRDKDAQAFKKVSNRQKERNYRSEKQQGGDKRKNRRRGSRSRSRSKSLSRSRSRSRSPRPARGRARRSRSRSYSRSRSRSRSNNKENQGWRQGRRGAQNRGRFQRQRPTRRAEMPRYDVRYVIGSQRNVKDRYGRDTSRQPRNSRSISRGRAVGRPRSFSRTRSRSASPKRNRRCSFSMSPTPPGMVNRHSISPRRMPPARRRSGSLDRRSPIRSPLRARSHSATPKHRMNGRKVTRRMRSGSPLVRRHSRSVSASPNYTPRLHRSRSKTPPVRPKGKKKKSKDRRKKKIKRREESPGVEQNIRIARQRDPFDDDGPQKKRRRHSPKAKSPVEDVTWSPSPSPPPIQEYERDNNVSWTPPIVSPQHAPDLHDLYAPEPQRSESKASKKDKRKRVKKKKRPEKRREIRKDKRRRRTETPEPAPSKEVFASGNNILVSVSFNKEAANLQQQQPQQTTVVTLPPTREDLLSGRRTSVDRMTNNSMTKKKKERAHKRKKLEAKPVAIIDLERSPFQVHQEPADIIVLTDSEDAHDNERQHQHEHGRRDRRHSESMADDIEHHRPSQLSNNTHASSHHDKSPPMERLDAILEESYDVPQTGPKTPPEPLVVKFNIPAKKQNKVRNPLHDEADHLSENELQERQEQEQHRPDLDAIHAPSSQKIGPNTPPESGPCSPDAYDPFEPTKSPSMSPRSPTPPPMDTSQTSIGDSTDGGLSTQKHAVEEPRLSGERSGQPASGTGIVGSQASTLNPVELVMALMNTKTNNSQDLANKSNESQFSTSSHMLSSSGVSNAHDDGVRDKSDDGNGITVLSNVLLNVSNTQQSQHIPVISSPTPIVKSTPIMKLPLPKVGSSVGSSSGIAIPTSSGNMRNGDDSFNINDIESPYSPGSADYEDLFEPPPDTSSAKRRSKRPANAGGKAEVFDNLFGSTSPVGHLRLPSYTASRKHKPAAGKKSKVKVGKSTTDEHIKVYDDVPNSAVELQVKDKFLRKLNRQERVVEEVKMVLKPRFNKKQITKEDYKEIMRRAVPKICHSRSGEINPHKIKNLIEAYVKKFRAKHKKLNLINTGQVSSAVKCAAYLKKL